ncbi:MAG: hypothetical protein ABSF83_04215 [Nitrososphaerales archaeon]|jgi:hypothetical protein
MRHLITISSQAGKKHAGQTYEQSLGTSNVNLLRTLAASVLILVVVDSLLGSSLMAGHLSLWTTIPHVAVAILTVGIAALALFVSSQLPGWRRRISAGLSLGSTIAAGVCGLAYVYGGENLIAVDLMGDFAGLVLIGAILLLVWGSSSG